MPTLRMFTEAELGYFDDDKDPADTMDFFGLRNSVGVRARWAQNGLVTPDAGGTLAVDLDGEVIGSVSWRPITYGPPPVPASFNIGIALHRQFRGQGHGSAVQRQLGDYLFRVYPVYRLEAGTDVSNLAEQRALVKAGFQREGVLRGAQFRQGQYRDLVQYSRLRDDNPDAPAA